MSTHWANIGDDEGALHALLHRLREHVPVSLIDYLWIFPPRRVAAGESVVFIAAAFDDDPGKRRVITAHFTIARNRKGQASVNHCFDEHGSAPAAALTRIVDGVLHRLGEDGDTTLRHQQIGGDLEQWNALILELGGTIQGATEAGLEPADTTASNADEPAAAADTVVGPPSSPREASSWKP